MTTNPFHIDNLDPIGKAAGSILKGGPGSGRHPEGTTVHQPNPFFLGGKPYTTTRDGDWTKINSVEPSDPNSTHAVKNIEVHSTGLVDMEVRTYAYGKQISSGSWHEPPEWEEVEWEGELQEITPQDVLDMNNSVVGREASLSFHPDGSPEENTRSVWVEHDLQDPIYSQGVQVGVYQDAVANLLFGGAKSDVISDRVGDYLEGLDDY